MKMKSEFKLLKYLAKNPTTRFHESGVYKIGDYQADIQDLLDEGLIRTETYRDSKGIDSKHYKITVKGDELLKQRRNRFWQIILSIIILLVTIITLILSM